MTQTRMTSAVIELNDSDVRVVRSGKVIAHGPGIAVIRDGALSVGEEAARQARLDPRLTFSRFWGELNQDPLRVQADHVRHHADLAFAHLRALHERAGKPEQVVFAVPGSYTADQLALLLGIAEAVPLSVTGLVDSAVAAAAAAAGPGMYQHVDLHLHQAVVTRLDVGATVQRTGVKVVEGAGMAAMQDRAASAIADLFIQQARLDPLHHATTEQALYDQLPAAMVNLGSRPEVLLDILYANSRYQVRLSRSHLQQALEPLFARVRAAAEPQARWLLSHRVAGIPGAAEQLRGAHVLPDAAVFEGCVQIKPAPAGADGVSFVTSLEARGGTGVQATPVPPVANVAQSAVTHALIGKVALPLSARPLYVAADGTAGPARKPGTLCSVALDNGSVKVEVDGGTTASLNGARVAGAAVMNPGDRLGFNGSEITLTAITVVDGDAAF